MEVCVTVFNSTLFREVAVNISSSDVDAEGKLFKAGHCTAVRY